MVVDERQEEEACGEEEVAAAAAEWWAAAVQQPQQAEGERGERCERDSERQTEEVASLLEHRQLQS